MITSKDVLHAVLLCVVVSTVLLGVGCHGGGKSGDGDAVAELGPARSLPDALRADDDRKEDDREDDDDGEDGEDGAIVAFVEADETVGDTSTVELALGDLDGDGSPDLVTADAIGSHVWLNTGDGRFADSQQALGGGDAVEPSGLAIGDLDADGDLDLVEARFDVLAGAVILTGRPDRVLLNDGSGILRDSRQALGTTFTRSVALADLNADGRLDILGGNNGPNTVRLNNGGSNFVQVFATLGNWQTSSVAIGDVDADGDLDFVSGNSGTAFSLGTLAHQPNRVWRQRDNGSFFSDQALGSQQTLDVTLGDLDGDDDLDLAVGNVGPDQTWLNDGAGRFTPGEDFPGESTTNDVELGDLDLDGDLDLVAATSDGTQVWLNEGDGSFTLLDTLGAAAFAVSIGELDGDGDLDLVTGANDGAHVWFNEAE